MFTEVLRVKPVLDEGTAKAMETSLSSRFSRVANRFGSGLKNIIKGSVLGISLGLLQKILNPIEALDDKIKGLLGHGTTLADLSDRFGASPGELKQLEDVARSFGLGADQFKDMMLKFADSIEKARDELANPFKERSESTLVVGRFANEKDMARSFKEFLSYLQKTTKGPGTDQPLTANASRIFAEAAGRNREVSEDERQRLIAAGEVRRRSGAETAIAFQKAVLGGQQFGGGRKLIEGNIDAQLKKINEPTAEELTKTVDKLAALDTQKRLLEIQNETRDFVSATNKLNADMIKSMTDAQNRTQTELTERLDIYKNLKSGADAIQDIGSGMSKLLDGVSVGLGYLKVITGVIPQITGSPMLKGILKTFGKKD